MDELHEDQDLIQEIHPPHESPEGLDSIEFQPHESPEGLGDPATAFETESLESLETEVPSGPESLGFVDEWQPEEIPQLPVFNDYESEEVSKDDWEEIDFGHQPLGELTDSVYHEQVQTSPLVDSVQFQPTEYPRQFPGPGYRTMQTAWM